ncbi:MAG: DUF3999 family protein [Flavobacteriaceae bacterium]
MSQLRIKSSGLLLLLSCFLSFGQTAPCVYQRSLSGISGSWHKIILPGEVLSKASDDLSDIRIFGFTAQRDTLEVPYLLKEAAPRVSQKDIPFKILNVAHNASGYYFTLEIPSLEAINQIKLDFKQQNFDWPMQLQASQNLTDWYTVIERDRLISIHNNSTDFEYTQLSFQNAKYRYFRLRIQSLESPDLVSARVCMQQISEATYCDYRIKSLQKKEDKTSQQTQINIELAMPSQLSCLNIKVRNGFDYYRPITIEQLTDSIKTQRGWHYNYATLVRGTLNSIKKNEFIFNSTPVHKLRITIDNQDNQPLPIESVTARGYQYALWARFAQPADYVLSYGNHKLSKPQYDLGVFEDKIPQTLSTLSLGAEIRLQPKTATGVEPLFKNKLWLWALMGVIILVLGWFSVKMLRSPSA